MGEHYGWYGLKLGQITSTHVLAIFYTDLQLQPLSWGC